MGIGGLDGVPDQTWADYVQGGAVFSLFLFLELHAHPAPLFKATTLSHGGQWGNPVTSGMLSVNLFYFWAKGLETVLKLPVSVAMISQ